jgi:hypothetical protein
MVSDKYTFDSNGFTNFMIVDTENNHYKVGNNLWFWKWDSIEDWSMVKKGNKIPITYYGFRLPFLGIFPNVFCINCVLAKHNTLTDNSDSGLTNALSNALTTALTTAK